MKRTSIAIMSGILLFTSCKDATPQKNSETSMTENPLLIEWNTPHGVPPFDKIKSSDYLPAFKIALKENENEIKAISENTETPTFQNTIEALEFSGKNLKRLQRIFYAVNSANTDDTLKVAAKEITPAIAAHNDFINLNATLYERVKAVYDQKEDLSLTPEEERLLEETHKNFVRAGISLEGKDQNRLREINTQLAKLSSDFGENLLDETNNFEYHTTDKNDLGNLPQSLVSLAAAEAKKRGHKEGWSFTLQRPSINPFLQTSPNRDARKILFDGYAMRANNDNENDNKAILSEMAALRLEKANLLGYDSHAAYILSDNMAETPEAVYGFMDKLWPSALEMAKSEREALAKKMATEGINGEFRGSDWRYYVEKVRKERYNFDEEETRPYFEVNAVRDGVFALASELFGLTFKEMNHIPKWHEDQQVFEVLEANGTHLGIIYMDFFARESKRGGAWMNALRSQMNVDGMVTPIVTNNFNYPAPSGDSPSLLSFTEAETLFHEFGHALHGLFSNVKYESLSGTNVPRDFVEFPSQVMENWMSEPRVLRMFAKHYQTGEVIPDTMIKKMKDANSFNGGFATVEYMAAAYLDMAWHSKKEDIPTDVNAFEKQAMDDLGLIEEIVPRYRSTYFGHIFSSPVGYSSGYYSYLWSEVLDADAFQAFKDTGNIFDAETAKRYRKMLSMGGSQNGMKLYKTFRGSEPEIEPLLKKKGFVK
ncbi:M3 family metallopeptidase [Kordia zhangzhouensis]|uniref:M3 family metallopeptidase n=1 Tax=Kordia zhangzhouensis TaxID=1620405 RepID=UPI0006295F64|nr:M3 family metallopeptidase [Kordia zhangzhouensis]